jgi:arylsulfatase A-like enzyme
MLPAPLLSPSSVRPMPRPNILWIVTTQWRAQACGFAGDPNARTPYLDALAAESLNYSEAVTPHPFGPFARAALLTGIASPQNGVADYYDPLPESARTIAHRLGERGYATAFFGKWHLAPRDRSAALVGETHARTLVPTAARGGFALWDGFEGGFQLNDPWLHGHRSALPVRERGYQSDVVCERAAGYVREATQAPWFALVSLEPPHPPYDASASGVRPRNPADIILPANVPLGGDIETRVRRELAGYYAHIEATDRAIGRSLLPAVPPNTVVVFTSVHGDMHGAHGLLRKGWPHEESIRVPLLVRMPATDPTPAGGGRRPDPASLLDLASWTISWSENEQAAQHRGPQFISMPSVVALPHQCDRAWRGLRFEKRKLVLNPDGSPWLFFNLEQDPLEMENLASQPAAAREIESLARHLV